ncbi:MAG: radical SAM protein [Candidatus Omnitrophota bacterium]
MLVPWKNFRRFSRKVFRQPGYALRVAFRRLSAFFNFSFFNGRSSPPEAITLFLTHRCNLRCKMCGQWGESGVTKTMCDDSVKELLPLSALTTIIDDVRRFKPSITLFGGEPLLHPECLELIRYIKKNKMHSLMITNGSLLNNFAEKLVDAGLDELNVSLDGGKELHDAIRGLPGLFEKVTAGLKLVNSYKQKKGVKKPLINLQCTITKYNYKKLEQLIEVAKEIKADSLTFHNLIFLGNDLIDQQREFDQTLNCSSEAWKGFVFEPEIDPDMLYKKIQKILTGQYSFAVDFYPNLSLKGLKEYYYNPSYLPSEYPKRCLSPWITGYVFPDGTVRPCLNSSFSFGNIKVNSFTGVWNSVNAVMFRKTLKKSSIFPVCVRCTELYRY